MHHSRQPRQSVTGLFLGLVVIFGLVWVDFERIAQAEGGVPRVVGVATAIDGDTLEIHGYRIRLHAIDAPEGKQVCQWSDGSSWYCGQRAALALADKIGRSAVTCIGRDHDRYGRMVAVCSVRGEDLNRWMVSEGWAVAYRRYGTDYVADEDLARLARRGLWAGAFTMPWDWRSQNR